MSHHHKISSKYKDDPGKTIDCFLLSVPVLVDAVLVQREGHSYLPTTQQTILINQTQLTSLRLTQAPLLDWSLLNLN